MEQCGLVERQVLPTSPPSVEYSLNALGQRLVPAIEAIAAVGEDLQQRRRERPKAKRKMVKPKHFQAARSPVQEGSS